jgi:hypothetical protein
MSERYNGRCAKQRTIVPLPKNINTDPMNANFMPFVSFDFAGNVLYLQLHLWHGTDRRFLRIIIPSP